MCVPGVCPCVCVYMNVYIERSNAHEVKCSVGLLAYTSLLAQMKNAWNAIGLSCCLFDAGLIATPNCATVADGKVRLCPGSEEEQARRLEQLWMYVKNAGKLHTIHTCKRDLSNVISV